jgi:hypothetical protein
MNEALWGIVQKRKSLEEVISELDLSAEDSEIFRSYLLKELEILAEFNCARFKLTMEEARALISAGRPMG